MGDLDKLIAAVESGNIAPFYGEFRSALGETLRDDGVKAFDGSLDAALRLHEALLPGWSWGRWSNGHMWVTDDIDDADRFVSSRGYFQDIFSRAWLLAILRAVKARDVA